MILINFLAYFNELHSEVYQNKLAYSNYFYAQIYGKRSYMRLEVIEYVLN